MELRVWINVLAVVLFLGFSTASFIAFSTIDKQKEITIPSRYGRQTGPLEILYVNVALIVVAYMLYKHSYQFLPTIIAFVVLIFLNSRMQSGIAPRGVFIGITYLEWDRIKEYQIVNDEISTFKIYVFANKKRYVLRCDKTYRAQILEYFEHHSVAQK